MKRREFLAASSAAAGLAITGEALTAKSGETEREFIELRTFRATDAASKAKLIDAVNEGVFKTCKKLGYDKVGLFQVNSELHADDKKYEKENDLAVFVLTSSVSMEQLVLGHERLAAMYAPGQTEIFPGDNTFMDTFDVSLHHAFPKCPRVTVPSRSPDRVLQLRRYYSPNLERNRKKRAMFEDRGELDLFVRCGMNPVFFSETLIGSYLPNVTYMLSFDNDEARKAGWKKFVDSPEWKTMKQEPQFAHTATRVRNLLLKPLPASEI